MLWMYCFLYVDLVNKIKQGLIFLTQNISVPYKVNKVCVNKPKQIWKANIKLSCFNFYTVKLVLCDLPMEH